MRSDEKGRDPPGRGRPPSPEIQAHLTAWAIVRAHAETDGPDWTRLINRYLAAVTTTGELDEAGALALLVHSLARTTHYEAERLARTRHEDLAFLLERHERHWLKALTP